MNSGLYVLMEKAMLKAYDVVIMGGGLSGLTLAIQLKRRIVNMRILIAEKSAYPIHHRRVSSNVRQSKVPRLELY
jgi:flavin-dependent dehydrogenase